MKLLTLNTHSLIIPEHEAKREIFVDFIAKEQPEVFALQEVNQTAAAPLLAEAPAGYYPCPGNMVLLKADNHAAAVAKMLEARGVHYDWSWLPAKVGYDIYDEGAAVFSRAPITDAENLLLSQINDYNNWKTRRTLGVCAGDVWYYTVHLGWWKDEVEPFAPSGKSFQRRRAQKRLPFCWATSTAKPMCGARATTLCWAAAGRIPTALHSSGTRATRWWKPLTAGGMPRMQRQKSASTRSGAPRRWMSRAAGWCSMAYRSRRCLTTPVL